MSKAPKVQKSHPKSLKPAKPGKSGRSVKALRGYHHGDLAAVLLTEAEKILEKDGIQALTLRAAARAAGVSHTAPQNHFGDLSGLLSELAAVGFARLAARMNKAVEEVTETFPAARMKAIGRTYVAFARAHPGLFTLMFRGEKLDTTCPALATAMGALRQTLAEAAAGAQSGAQTAAALSAPAPGTSLAPSLAGLTYSTAMWSVVHGYAMLLIDGRLKGTLAQLPAGENAETLLEQVLSITGAPRR